MASLKLNLPSAFISYFVRPWPAYNTTPLLHAHLPIRRPLIHVLQLGARPKEEEASASPGGQSASVREATKATAKPVRAVLYPYAGGSGLGNRTLDLLAEARDRGAAVGAFTVYSLEGIRAVVRAAEATGRSAILQVQQCNVAASVAM